MDLSNTIIAKSDQLNADDLLSGAKILNITGVKQVSGDQPVHISYEGCEKRVYKPSKSMRRVMIAAWGPDGDDYVGRRLLVYRDEKIKWAGEEVGGIIILRMSHIKEPMRISLMVSRGKKSPYIINPFPDEKPANKLTEEEFQEWKDKIDICATMDELGNVAVLIKNCNFDKEGAGDMNKYYSDAMGKIREGEKS